jgi:hypothetical protein
VGVPQNQSGRSGEERNLMPLPKIETRFLGHKASSQVTIPTELFRIPDSPPTTILFLLTFPLLFRTPYLFNTNHKTEYVDSSCNASYMQDVSGLNLGSDTEYFDSDILWFFSVTPGKCWNTALN